MLLTLLLPQEQCISVSPLEVCMYVMDLRTTFCGYYLVGVLPTLRPPSIGQRGGIWGV